MEHRRGGGGPGAPHSPPDWDRSSDQESRRGQGPGGAAVLGTWGWAGRGLVWLLHIAPHAEHTIQTTRLVFAPEPFLSVSTDSFGPMQISRNYPGPSVRTELSNTEHLRVASFILLLMKMASHRTHHFSEFWFSVILELNLSTVSHSSGATKAVLKHFILKFCSFKRDTIA